MKTSVLASVVHFIGMAIAAVMTGAFAGVVVSPTADGFAYGVGASFAIMPAIIGWNVASAKSPRAGPRLLAYWLLFLPVPGLLLLGYLTGEDSDGGASLSGMLAVFTTVTGVVAYLVGVMLQLARVLMRPGNSSET